MIFFFLSFSSSLVQHYRLRYAQKHPADSGDIQKKKLSTNLIVTLKNTKFLEIIFINWKNFEQIEKKIKRNFVTNWYFVVNGFSQTGESKERV